MFLTIRRRLGITAVAVVAVAAGGSVAATKAFATPDHATPPRIGTALSAISLPADASAPQLPGISARALAQFGVLLEAPAGRGEAHFSADQARHVALPLGEGPQSQGWSVVGAPVLAFVDFRASASATRTCLCWAVELNTTHGIPCDVPLGVTEPSVDKLCDNHHLVEFVDAATGSRWLSFSGHALG
jgi:hypothetical protein